MRSRALGQNESKQNANDIVSANFENPVTLQESQRLFDVSASKKPPGRAVAETNKRVPNPQSSARKRKKRDTFYFPLRVKQNPEIPTAEIPSSNGQPENYLLNLRHQAHVLLEAYELELKSAGAGGGEANSSGLSAAIRNR